MQLLFNLKTAGHGQAVFALIERDAYSKVSLDTRHSAGYKRHCHRCGRTCIGQTSDLLIRLKAGNRSQQTIELQTCYVQASHEVILA